MRDVSAGSFFLKILVKLKLCAALQSCIQLLFFFIETYIYIFHHLSRQLKDWSAVKG